VNQASAVAAPGVLGPGVKGFKAELGKLRERMRGLGFSYDEIAAEVSRRYQVRPREAHRLAWGWTLDQAAGRFNDSAAREGTDPHGRASMTGPHLCEIEKWPYSERRPSAYVLCLLAVVYDTDVLCLLDLADHESLPQQDRLILTRRQRAEAPSGKRALAEARGLSPRAPARRMPCDASHLSKVVHGRKRPPLRVAARLDDALEAAGELVSLAGMEEAAHGDASEPGQDPRRRAADGQPATAGGMTLTLSYVPARLVIEASGPAGSPGLLAGAADDSDLAPGRLALVRDRTPSPARTGTAAGDHANHDRRDRPHAGGHPADIASAPGRYQGGGTWLSG
jgi:transcriptional regulator with XRE-family HTH domain